MTTFKTQQERVLNGWVSVEVDGAGVASMMAAAAFIGQMEQRPKRSIRVLLFAGEEIGFYGVNAYLEKHKDALAEHLLGAEVDSIVCTSTQDAGTCWAQRSTATT